MINQTNATQTRNITAQAPQKKLSPAEIKEITRAYTQMFVALTYTNLMRGQTLGQSWYSAMKQMESFIGTKDKFNAAATQIKSVLDEHRKKLSRQMMTHPNRDKKAVIAPQHREKIQAQINKNMQAGMGALNKIVGKYQPLADKMRAEIAKLDAEKAKLGLKDKPAQTATANQFANAQQKITATAMQKMQLQLFLQMQKQHQHTA